MLWQIWFTLSLGYPLLQNPRSNFPFHGKDYNILSLSCLKGNLYSPTICYKLVAQHLEDNNLSLACKLFHYMDVTIIIGSIEQKVGETLSNVVDIMQKHRWEINPKKTQEPTRESMAETPSPVQTNYLTYGWTSKMKMRSRALLESWITGENFCPISHRTHGHIIYTGKRPTLNWEKVIKQVLYKLYRLPHMLWL